MVSCGTLCHRRSMAVKIFALGALLCGVMGGIIGAPAGPAAASAGAAWGSTAEAEYAAHPDRAQRPERWAPPLGRPISVVGPYRAPPHKYGAGHRGIDLPALPGEVLLAPIAATVSFAGPVAGRGVISLRVDERTVVSIEPVAAGHAAGVAVGRGQQIGTVASGGHCGSECIHLGVRVDDEYVNPMRFFANRPVLLPWE